MCAPNINLVQRETRSACENDSDTGLVVGNNACRVGFSHDSGNLWDTTKRSINYPHQICIADFARTCTFLFQFA